MDEIDEQLVHQHDIDDVDEMDDLDICNDERVEMLDVLVVHVKIIDEKVEIV